MRRSSMALLLCALLGPAAVPGATADRPPTVLAALLGPADSLLVTGADGRPVAEWQAHRPRIPASVLKLLTAQTVLDRLGPDHRFVTPFFQDADGALYVEGRGDPLLVSEVLAAAAGALVPHLAPVRAVVVDDGHFVRPLAVPGVTDSDNPYDAPLGALSVNFNTVNVRRTPAGPVSAEPQTPLIPFARGLLAARDRAAGGRLVLTRDSRQAALYAGHLLRHFLAAAGAEVSGEVRTGTVPPTARAVLRFASPFDLSAVVARMMTFSNNFIANQILVAAAADVYGPPGSLEKGVRLLEEEARRLDLADAHLVEGSGISRSNRVSAADLDAVLAAFAGQRHLLRREGRVWSKTGTLHDVRSRAGYIETRDGLCRFVILVNTPGRSADPVLDAVLRLLPADQ